MRAALVAFAIVCNPACLVCADAMATAELNERLSAQLAANGVKSGSWLMLQASGERHFGYFGNTDRSSVKRINEDTRFRAGSVSKTLTALLVLRLHHQGRVDLTRPVKSLVEGLPVRNRWAASDPITLGHLLEHTSGLAGSSYRDYATDLPNATGSQFLEHVGELRPRWRPGAFYSYSNTGYGLVGAVLERATGESFDSLMLSEVFEPLGIETGSFRTEGDIPNLVATGYDSRGVAQPTWAMPMRPAGALVITPGDLAKVVRMLLSRGTLPDGTIFLPLELIERMELGKNSLVAKAGANPGADGLGQFGFVINGRIYRGHWGKTEGFLTNFGYLPDHGVGFVLMINTDAPRAMAECRSIIDQFLTSDFPPPPRTATVLDSTETDVSGNYVNVTHDMPRRDWVFRMLDQKRITKTEDGGYLVKSVGPHGNSADTYRHAVTGGFIADSLPVPTAAVVEEEGVTYWVDGEAYRKVSALEAYARRWGFFAALMVAAAVVAVWPIAWLYCRIRRTASQTTGRLIRAARAAAMVASLSLLATVFLFVRYGLLGNSSDLKLVGAVSWVSVALAIGSLTFVFSAIAAAVLALLNLMKSRRVLDGLRLLVLSPLVGVAFLWLASGWAPLLTWR